jgi:hypothetical protein
MNLTENSKIDNPSGRKRIQVTRVLQGHEWVNIVSYTGYRIETGCNSDKYQQGRGY